MCSSTFKKCPVHLHFSVQKSCLPSCQLYRQKQQFWQHFWLPFCQGQQNMEMNEKLKFHHRIFYKIYKFSISKKKLCDKKWLFCQYEFLKKFKVTLGCKTKKDVWMMGSEYFCLLVGFCRYYSTSVNPVWSQPIFLQSYKI